MDEAVRCLLFPEGAEIIFLVCYIPEDRDQLGLGVRGIALGMHRGPGGMRFVEFGSGLSTKLSGVLHLMKVEYEFILFA